MEWTEDVNSSNATDLDNGLAGMFTSIQAPMFALAGPP